MSNYCVTLLKKLRRENGLTQQQMADFLHLDRSSYAYYESGRTKLSLEVLLRLARFFKISMAELVGEEPALSESGELADGTQFNEAAIINDSVCRFGQLSRAEQHLVILFRSVEAEQQGQILRAAQDIADSNG